MFRLRECHRRCHQRTIAWPACGPTSADTNNAPENAANTAGMEAPRSRAIGAASMAREVVRGRPGKRLRDSQRDDRAMPSVHAVAIRMVMKAADAGHAPWNSAERRNDSGAPVFEAMAKPRSSK